jgi:hypothetical protein
MTFNADKTFSGIVYEAGGSFAYSGNYDYSESAKTITITIKTPFQATATTSYNFINENTLMMDGNKRLIRQ